MNLVPEQSLLERENDVFIFSYNQTPNTLYSFFDKIWVFTWPVDMLINSNVNPNRFKPLMSFFFMFWKYFWRNYFELIYNFIF